MKKLFAVLASVLVICALATAFTQAVVAAREVGRRASCVNKGHPGSMAFHNYSPDAFTGGSSK